MSFLVRPLACGVLFAAASTAVSAQDSPRPGFQVARLANPAAGAVSCTLANGDLATFDGSSIDRWSPTGAFVAHVGDLSTYAYPSFLLPTPDGAALVVGESGYQSYTGGLHLAPLDGSGVVPILALSFPYDAEFLPSGELLVSAATQGFGMGNDLVRVALAPASATWLGHVAGPSGPVAIAANGDTFYATVADGFSPPPAETEILRWSYAQVLAGGPLDESTAALVGSGFDGGASLAIEPRKGALYLAENHWQIGVHRIVRVRGNAAASLVVVDSAASWLGGLRFHDHGGAAIFEAYQPEGGVELAYTSTDFFSYDDVVRCTPARPQISFSGPGVGGIGQVDVTCTGGVPNGVAYLTYCPHGAVASFETPYRIPRFLHHTPFDLSQTLRVPLVLPADASGTASYSFFNDGSLQGLYGYQFLVGTSSAAFVGSSHAGLF
jgi:hypothetical protein